MITKTLTATKTKRVFNNLMKPGVVSTVVAAVMLVIGGVILTVALSITGQIGGTFACAQGDTNCQNAKTLIGVIPIIAAAVLIISGVWMLLPELSSAKST